MATVVVTANGRCKRRFGGLVNPVCSRAVASSVLPTTTPKNRSRLRSMPSHVVIDAYTKSVGEDIVLMNDWLVFNTSKGKDLQGLVEGGASFGTSIRGLGQLNEDTNEVENYDFLGCDAVGNPSAGTFASKEQFRVTVESVEPRQAARIKEQLEDTMRTQATRFDLDEKITEFREKYLKDGKPAKVTREMTEELLTMQRQCVEAGQDVEELDALSNEIFGEQSDPPPSPLPKPPAKNSNEDRDILNRAQRELEATQNLAVHLRDQVTELESAKQTAEQQLSAYRRVAESLQEQLDDVIREGDETTSFETARLVRKAASAVAGIQREAYGVITSLEERLETAIRIGDAAVDSAITLRRIADSLYRRELGAAESASGTWKHSRTAQATAENRRQSPVPLTEDQNRNRISPSGNRSGWV
jgi:hypothetical protein